MDDAKIMPPKRGEMKVRVRGWEEGRREGRKEGGKGGGRDRGGREGRDRGWGGMEDGEGWRVGRGGETYGVRNWSCDNIEVLGLWIVSHLHSIYDTKRPSALLININC